MTPFRDAIFVAVSVASTSPMFLKFPESFSRGTETTLFAARRGNSSAPRAASASERTSTTTMFPPESTSSYASTGRMDPA